MAQTGFVDSWHMPQIGIAFKAKNHLELGYVTREKITFS